jgi:ABC-type polysaccharide/polyol phosphate transport system ATPase subunit
VNLQPGEVGLRDGEVVLRDATRSFSVRADQARTLKGLLLGRRAAGPAPVPALQGVTLHVEPGETVGMVGRNGAGKTSTLRVLAGIVPLASGYAACGGRVVSLLELAAGFSRDFTGRENIYLQGALHGFGKAELEQRIDRIIAFSELEDFIDIPVKTYSSGMFVRLGFSIAAHLDADVLLIDEVLAVGDEAFQRKCLRRISEHIAAGATLVLVSHDPGAVERVCERVVVLDAGRIVFDGPTAEGLLHYHRLMGTEHRSGESFRPQRDRPGLEARDQVAVIELELRDALGRSSSFFHTGMPMQVYVGLRVPEEVPGGWLTLELLDGAGSTIYRTRTTFQAAGDGTARLVLDVPDLALLGGDYDLAVAASARDEPTPADRTTRFAVAGKPGAEGIIDLRGSWHSPAPADGVR